MPSQTPSNLSTSPASSPGSAGLTDRQILELSRHRDAPPTAVIDIALGRAGDAPISYEAARARCDAAYTDLIRTVRS